MVTYTDETENLNHRNVWVVYDNSNANVTFNLLTGLTRKRTPKPRLVTTEKIESDYDPNDND